MKKLLLFTALSIGLLTAKSTIHVISTAGFTFSPSTTNAEVGDTIVFNVTTGHTATEVSNATWTANGTTALGGGFNFTPPGGTVILSASGTRYFVCQIHVGTMGMKGTINVSPVGYLENEKEISINIYPNPAVDILNVAVSGNTEKASMEIVNLLGSKVMTISSGTVLQNGTRKIDVSALPKGIYFLNVVNENGTRSIRFVKK